MKSFTLHNVDDEVYKQLRLVAQSQDTSLNSVAKRVLREGLGVANKKKKRDLSMLVGMWSKEEGKKFDRYIEQEFERIDEEDWK